MTKHAGAAENMGWGRGSLSRQAQTGRGRETPESTAENPRITSEDVYPAQTSLCSRYTTTTINQPTSQPPATIPPFHSRTKDGKDGIGKTGMLGAYMCMYVCMSVGEPLR